MAIAGRWMARHFNRPGFEMFDYDVYSLAGDGCLMEGVSAEAASLAGHLRLGNLCWIYDSNRITIEGSTDLAFYDDVGARFTAYGWHVLRVADANDVERIHEALVAFRGVTDRPTLIIVDSHIGYGAPHKQDTSAAHGEPLSEEEVRLTKRAYGWPEDSTFLAPDGVRAHFDAGIGARGRAIRAAWMARFEAYRREHPALADELYAMQHRQLPAGWDADLSEFPADATGVSGRDASARVLNAIAPRVPWLIGGSADLSPSTKTRLTFEGAGDILPGDWNGRNLHFGVREHAMGAVLNGLSLSKVRPFGSRVNGRRNLAADFCQCPWRLPSRSSGMLPHALRFILAARF
jgi:transketolase